MHDDTHDDDVRDLVRTAYETDPVDFDVRAGLDALRNVGKRTLVVRSTSGEYRFDAGTTVLFGRNTPNVHVELGVSDPKVSRVHGEVVHRGGVWYLRNRGRSPIHLEDGIVIPGQERPLTDGTTSMYVVGTGARQHVLELHVGVRSDEPWAVSVDAVTTPPRDWRLTPAERLVLSVVGRRYLVGEPRPRPLTVHEAATELAALVPEQEWTPRKVSHIVSVVESRLSRSGVVGLTPEEFGAPVAGRTTHNLLIELLRTGTLTLVDLEALEQSPA